MSHSDASTEDTVTAEAVVPILRIFDEDAAAAFYEDFLGFRRNWEHRFEPGMPLYAEVERCGITLHLSGHHGDCCPGATVFVWMRGLDAFHAEISARDYPACNPGIEDTFYDARCMTVTDPFGNRIRFNERNGSPA